MRLAKCINCWDILLVILIIIVIFFLALVIAGCKEEPKEVEAIECPAIVITGSENYLLVRDALNSYERIYDQDLIYKYKAGETIKDK